MKSLASVIAVVVTLSGWQWWFTPDQQGDRLMARGEFMAAADVYRDPMRIGTAYYRAGEFEKAEQAFARSATSEAEFNRGNCLVLRGKYTDAVGRYDRALDLQPDWKDATINRQIASLRAKRMEQKGGEMGDQRIGADEIRFDKKKNDAGQETETEGAAPLSDSAMQALWLRKVQTKPADFLRSKFAYQLSLGEETSP
ncbi:MAG: tetratricopeptide repeat protein [Rubripirellula sp.]